MISYVPQLFPDEEELDMISNKKIEMKGRSRLLTKKKRKRKKRTSRRGLVMFDFLRPYFTLLDFSVRNLKNNGVSIRINLRQKLTRAIIHSVRWKEIDIKFAYTVLTFNFLSSVY